MIIVEGADNCGKSRLIHDLLALDPSLSVLHRERFKPSRTEGLNTIGASYLKALFPENGDRVRHANSIADRFFASECIYGPTVRDGCRMTAGEHLAIRQTLRAYGTIVVYCDPPTTAIEATWQDREQAYDAPRTLAVAYKHMLYDVFKGFQIVRYDWTSADAASVRQSIVELHFAKTIERHDFLTWWGTVPYGIGSPTPRVLLVGESPSPNAIVPAPFAHGPAGNFLAGVIQRQDIEADCYITNALKGTDHDVSLLRSEIWRLHPHVIVALGREAERMLAQLGVPGPIVSLPHPMYWKRFHASEVARYDDMLRTAIAPFLQPELLANA